MALGAAGAAVAVCARRADRLDTLVQKIEAAGSKAIALPGDIAEEKAATRVVTDTLKRFGRLDILVNSAGVIQAGGVENADTAHREAIRKHVAKEGAMLPEDVAAAIVFVVSLPPRANVSEILIRPTIDTAPM